MDEGQELYELALELGDSSLAPTVAYHLGMLLLEVGDGDGARGALERCLSLAAGDLVADANFALGRALKQLGELEAAQVAFERAIILGDPEIASRAAMLLAMLRLEDLYDAEGAEASLRKAISFGQPDIVPLAAGYLGNILSARGDRKDAIGAYQMTVEAKQPEVSTWATKELQQLLDGEDG
jgi:tetratricopeptide (TPR) repeat protein